MHMKKFYRNLFFLVLIVAVIFAALDFLSTRGYTREIFAKLTDSEEYFVNNGPDTVNPIIRKVQKEDGTKVLILGDSVASQLFNDLSDNNPDILILPGNAGVTIAGQYVIAKEYLEHHPDATDIYLFVLPESLGRTFDTKWGYQYAVLPFVETDTLGDFDDNTVQIMEKTYGSLFLNKTVATLVDQSGINRKLYLNYLRDRSEGYIPENYYEIADQYLVKLEMLCREKGVKLSLIPCPVSEVKREQIAALESDYKDTATYRIFPQYYHMISYYPAECFGDDTHFSKEYRSREYLDSVIIDMLDGTELLNMLKLSQIQ